MSLTVVSTPIGNFGDITLRAIETLRESDFIVCEEIRPASTLLKKLGVVNSTSVESAKGAGAADIGASKKIPELLQLNEHSHPEDIQEIAKKCASNNVSLISDCGTPGFCDPGPELVRACYEAGVAVNVNPGASSLMSLIALSGVRLNEFYFVGFLPAERLARQKKLTALGQLKMPLVIMDTPYRVKATLQELAGIFGRRSGVLGMDLTGENQALHRGALLDLAKLDLEKLPFVLLIE